MQKCMEYRLNPSNENRVSGLHCSNQQRHVHRGDPECFDALSDALEIPPINGFAIETGIEERPHLHGTKSGMKVDTDNQAHGGLHEIEGVLHGSAGALATVRQ